MNPQNIHIKEAMDTLLKMFDENNLEIVARAVFKELIKCLNRIEKVVNFVIERTTAGIAAQPIPCMREVL